MASGVVVVVLAVLRVMVMAVLLGVGGLGGRVLVEHALTASGRPQGHAALGHEVGQVAVISACMGQANAVGASVSACAGMSFIPHFGHLSAQEATISGCIGQA